MKQNHWDLVLNGTKLRSLVRSDYKLGLIEPVETENCNDPGLKWLREMSNVDRMKWQVAWKWLLGQETGWAKLQQWQFNGYQTSATMLANENEPATTVSSQMSLEQP